MRSTSSDTTRSAEIIIFPGIRYEYWHDSVAAPAKAARVKRKRSSGAKRASRRIKRDHLEISA